VTQCFRQISFRVVSAENTRQEEIRVVWISVQRFYYIMTEALLRLDDGPARRNNKVNMIAVVFVNTQRLNLILKLFLNVKEMENVLR